MSEAGPGTLLIVGAAPRDAEAEALATARLSGWLTAEGWTLARCERLAAVDEVLARGGASLVLVDLERLAGAGVEALAVVPEVVAAVARWAERFPRVGRLVALPERASQELEQALERAELLGVVTSPVRPLQLRPFLRTASRQKPLSEEIERLAAVARRQQDELRTLGLGLDARVAERTQLLAQAKREWELSFDSIDTPLAVVDTASLRLMRANLAYARTAGRPVQEIGERPRCHQFLFNRPTPCPNCPLLNGKGAESRGELQHQGRRYVVNVYPMADVGRAVCTYRDTTEEGRVTRQLVEAEKMAAVGLLAGGVAHEVNNPLGAILAFAQLMQRDEGRSAEDIEALGLIEESALRCKRIVESLLKLSRRRPQDPSKPFDVGSCIEDAALLFRAQLKSFPRAKLDVSVPRELPRIAGDPSKLGQALLNLLQNALQALPDGAGTLTVEAVAEETFVRVRVRDTGTGIPPDVLPRIFEPWFTTKPPGQGTGLGLAITFRIIQEHGGTIDVESELGRGTQFTLSLPAAVELPSEVHA